MKPKTKDGEKINLYVSKDVKRRLIEIAERNHRSASQQVEFLVEREWVSSKQASDVAEELLSEGAMEVFHAHRSHPPKREVAGPNAPISSRGRGAAEGLKTQRASQGVVPSEHKAGKK